jgi:proton-translocating NADH-quinone oxidoreductase chain N
MFFRSDLIAIAPEIFLILAIHFLILYGVMLITSSRFNYPIILNNLTWLSIQALIFVGILIYNNPLSYILCFNNLLVVDNFSLFVKTILTVSTILTLLISIKYNQFERINAFELILLFLLALLGNFFLVSSGNLISMYLSIELQSFCLYIVAALNRGSEFSTEAGLKYFILGAFSSGLLLFGSSLIYGFTGTTDLEQLQQFMFFTHNSIFSNHGINLAIVFICVGLFFKLSAVPFHIWTPDIYEGAPTSVTAFFSIVPKIGILSMLTRLNFYSFYEIFLPGQELIILSAIGSIILGTFGAFMQFKLKRLMAYSSISHVGFILIGLSCGTIEGLQAAFIYIMFYMVMIIISFIFLLGFYKNGSLIRLNYLKDLGTITQGNPLLSFCLALTFFSMAGVPPLGGFFSKMFIFITAIQSSLYVLAIIGILMSVIACFYYIRIIKVLYFNETYFWLTLIRLDREKSLVLCVLMMFLIFVGFFPMPIMLVSKNAFININYIK